MTDPYETLSIALRRMAACHSRALSLAHAHTHTERTWLRACVWVRALTLRRPSTPIHKSDFNL